MIDQEFENMLARGLQQDFSAGTETFREELLARCLAELQTDEDVRELNDDELDLIAAAGSAFARENDYFGKENPLV